MACRPTVWGASLAACLLLSASPAAHALFEDDEARKAILELRARVAQNEELARTQQATLARILDEVSALRRSLLDLNNEIEQTRADLARLRGSDEKLLRDVSELQRRQQDIAQGLDARLRALEPAKVSLDGREFSAAPEEKRQFDAALALLREGRFDKAGDAFAAFLRRYPASGYTDSARFWYANALYGRRDYKEAVQAFRSFVGSAPEHPRAAEALLALANSQAEMKDRAAARRTIDELIRTYPNSEAAQAGKERLAALK
jgi:tol-pal system protein YbgF